MKALLIPIEGPLQDLDLDLNSNESLTTMQQLVGGYIQAIPLPSFIDGSAAATCYMDEEGKYKPDQQPNMRATDFLVPGTGLLWGDYISGPLLLCGFDPMTGTHRDIPQGVVDRARLIEKEAA